MCVLCPAQASLNWSAHIIRVPDRYIKVQWLEIACSLLSGDTHVLPFYVCVSGRVDSFVSCSPSDVPVPWGSVGLLCLSLYRRKEAESSAICAERTYINIYVPPECGGVQLVEIQSYKLEGRGFCMPYNVIRFFHWYNPSGRTMALGSTQPLMEMSTRNIFWRVQAAGA